VWWIFFFFFFLGREYDERGKYEVQMNFYCASGWKKKNNGETQISSMRNLSKSTERQNHTRGMYKA
jgi:hypothetical protein